MSIAYQVLGKPGGDNALLVRIDSGQLVERLLFDCGEGCVLELPFAEVQAIDQLLFSHLHMDHVGGFDSFLRATFDRDKKPNQIWGPPETGRILQHRFQGFLWNLLAGMRGTWRIGDVYADRVQTTRLELPEAFAVTHDEGSRAYNKLVVEAAAYTVEAVTLNHRTPTLGYIVREKPRKNIDISRLAALGLRPGPWLKQLKDGAANSGTISIGGVAHSASELSQALLVETPGDSIAYLTDFLLDDATLERLTDVLRGCQTVVCEAQYRHADVELALRNYHSTTVLSATLAARAGVQALVLFHLSSRYTEAAWREMLQESQSIFPATQFPEQWRASL